MRSKLGATEDIKDVFYPNALGVGFATGSEAPIGPKMPLCPRDLAPKAIEICHDLRKNTIWGRSSATLPRVPRLYYVSTVLRRFQSQRPPVAAHGGATYANNFVAAHE